MTVQEVKEQIQEYDKVAGLMMNIPHDVCMAIIESLSELEQYRALGTPTQIYEKIGALDVELGKYKCLGTVEELKEALEKQIPKKPIEDDTSYSGYKCPTCNSNIYQLRSHNIMQTPHCIFCGQALKWGEEDEND